MFASVQVDCAVTGSQKALSLPCGLAVVCASEKALKAREAATCARVYYDFGCAAATCSRAACCDWSLPIYRCSAAGSYFE